MGEVVYVDFGRESPCDPNTLGYQPKRLSAKERRRWRLWPLAGMMACLLTCFAEDELPLPHRDYGCAAAEVPANGSVREAIDTAVQALKVSDLSNPDLIDAIDHAVYRLGTELQQDLPPGAKVETCLEYTFRLNPIRDDSWMVSVDAVDAVRQ